MEMDNSNLVQIEEQENDWILCKIAKKLKIKIQDENIFLEKRQIHKFYGRIVKLKNYGILIIFFGNNLIILNENMVVSLLEKVKKNK